MNNINSDEPLVKRGGSAFCGNCLQGRYPVGNFSDRDNIKVVSLTEWCAKNFITKRIGRKLIALRYLLGFRRHRVWWVAANPDCEEELLEYLGVEQLLFEADNQ